MKIGALDILEGAITLEYKQFSSWAFAVDSGGFEDEDIDTLTSHIKSFIEFYRRHPATIVKYRAYPLAPKKIEKYSAGELLYIGILECARLVRKAYKEEQRAIGDSFVKIVVKLVDVFYKEVEEKLRDKSKDEDLNLFRVSL